MRPISEIFSFFELYNTLRLWNYKVYTKYQWIISDEQLWKVQDKTRLINKAGVWDPIYNVTVPDVGDTDFIIIDNQPGDHAYAVEDSINVIKGKKNPNDKDQKWKRGYPNVEGYFTLKNSKFMKFLTAVGPNLESGGLQIQKRSPCPGIPNPCTNETHGTCRDTESPKCDCNSGWKGDACEISACPGKPVCSNHGDCLCTNSNQGDCDVESYECKCHSGWKGDNCSKGISEEYLHMKKGTDSAAKNEEALHFLVIMLSFLCSYIKE